MTCITKRTCEKLTGDRKKDQEICGRCREVLKNDLARIVLEMNPIYLSEDNRNKNGKKPKISDAGMRNDIKQAHKNGMTIRELAERYEVGVATIHKIIHSHK